MKKNDIEFSVATIKDAEKLLEVYEPYVLNTAITFENDVPSIEEFQARIEKTLKKYPYIVAKKEDEILGYAYTSPFVGRAAYDWSAEVTIYLKEEAKRQGIGAMLYEILEIISKAQGICNLNACIGVPEVEDAHLTKNSVNFHAHLGYRMVGQFHKCGYKFDTWYHMAWMEKIINEHKKNPPKVIPFGELDLGTDGPAHFCGFRTTI